MAMPLGETKMGVFGFCVKFFVVVLFFGLVASIEPTRSPVRRGLQNVIRVGKRYGDEDFWELPTEDKRVSKLMAFPRVGRSSTTWTNDDSTEKRSDSNNGLWFGPRIGRSSSSFDSAGPWTYILWNEDKPLSRFNHNVIPRRQEQDISNENNAEELKEPLFPY